MITQEVKKKAFLCGLDYRKWNEEDIELAYEAYQQKMCDVGNLMIVAIRKAQNPDSEPFVVEETHSREETFSKLGIGGKV